MTKKKPVFALAMAIVFAVTAVTAQEAEPTLQETIERMIIRETARAVSLEQKMIALQFISNTMEAGGTGSEIIETLEFLATEGIINRTYLRGNLINNFPQARREAARLLGVEGSEEARQILIRVILVEHEPTVMAQAVNSLGVIGSNPNDTSAEAIAWAVTRVATGFPNNPLALSAIDAFQALAQSEDGIRAPNIVRLLVSISEGPYIRQVRERAHGLLMELMGHQPVAQAE